MSNRLITMECYYTDGTKDKGKIVPMATLNWLRDLIGEPEGTYALLKSTNDEVIKEMLSHLGSNRDKNFGFIGVVGGNKFSITGKLGLMAKDESNSAFLFEKINNHTYKATRVNTLKLLKMVSREALAAHVNLGDDLHLSRYKYVQRVRKEVSDEADKTIEYMESLISRLENAVRAGNFLIDRDTGEILREYAPDELPENWEEYESEAQEDGDT